MSPVEKFKLPKDEEVYRRPILAAKEESAKASPKRLFSAVEESDSKNPIEESY
jgi:hypothetical protein